MRFLQDVVVRGDTATTAVVQDNVFEDDVVGGDEDAVNNVFEILGTIGGTLIAVSFRSLSLSLSLCVCVSLASSCRGVGLSPMFIVVAVVAVVAVLWRHILPTLWHLSSLCAKENESNLSQSKMCSLCVR